MSEEKQFNKEITRDILKWVVIGLAGFAVVVLIFGAGMVVGGMKAKFSYRWAESYHKNFAGPREGFLGAWRSISPLPGDFIESHGAFGEIIQIDETGLVVKGRGEVEKLIIATQDITIQKGRETLKKEELKVGDRVVIIGSPNEEGQIEAKLIRIFDGELRGAPMPLKSSRFPFF